MAQQIEKLIKKAHDKITRTKGREYSPTALDIENEINKSFTAVEWLTKELNLEGYDYTVSQAKAMEKEQMYQVWKTSEEWSDGDFLDSNKSFEEYYNETYNK